MVLPATEARADGCPKPTIITVITMIGRIEPFSQSRCVREMLQLPSSPERGNPLLDKTRQHESLNMITIITSMCIIIIMFIIIISSSTTIIIITIIISSSSIIIIVMRTPHTGSVGEIECVMSTYLGSAQVRAYIYIYIYIYIYRRQGSAKTYEFRTEEPIALSSYDIYI